MGREGGAVQIAAAGASLMTPGVQAQRDKRRLLMAAWRRACGAVPHPPGRHPLCPGTVSMGGVVEYQSLLPAVVASLVAASVSGALGCGPAAPSLDVAVPAFSAETIIALVVLGGGRRSGRPAVRLSAPRAPPQAGPVDAQPLPADVLVGAQ